MNKGAPNASQGQETVSREVSIAAALKTELKIPNKYDTSAFNAYLT